MMRLHLLTTLVVVPLAGSLHAQTFEVGWYTVDGGGIMHGTDGQPDGFDNCQNIENITYTYGPVEWGGVWQFGAVIDLEEVKIQRTL